MTAAGQTPRPAGDDTAPLAATLPYRPESVAAARRIFAALQRARSVFVTSEPSPDADALGAELAVRALARHAFRTSEDGRERRVVLFNEDGCPERYRFVAGTEHVRRAGELEPVAFDLGIIVDGGIERVGPEAAAVLSRCRERICIDHHRFGSRERYDVALLEPRASSTTELLWLFVADPAIGLPLDRDLAEALYLGLVFDTGSFQYALTRPIAHRIAARLLATGFDFVRLHEKALLEKPLAQVRFEAAMLQRSQTDEDGRIVWSVIRRADLERFGVGSEHTGGVIQTLCFVQGVEAAAVLREQDEHRWKVSLRSRGRIDVGAVARQLDPQGGGHDRAAGCTLQGSEDEAVRRTLAALHTALGTPQVGTGDCAPAGRDCPR